MLCVTLPGYVLVVLLFSKIHFSCISTLFQEYISVASMPGIHFSCVHVFPFNLPMQSNTCYICNMGRSDLPDSYVSTNWRVCQRASADIPDKSQFGSCHTAPDGRCSTPNNCGACYINFKSQNFPLIHPCNVLCNLSMQPLLEHTYTNRYVFVLHHIKPNQEYHHNSVKITIGHHL